MQVLPIKSQDAQLSVRKAEMFGFLAGDGSMQGGPTTTGACCGIDRWMAEYCVSAFREIYGVEGKIVVLLPGKGGRKQENYNVEWYRALIREDIALWASFGLLDWRIPKAVQSGTKDVQAAWLRGLVEADGHVSYIPERSIRKVSVTSINRAGLEQVEALFRDGFGIRCRWTFRAAHEDEHGFHRDSWTLNLCYHADVKAFAREIGIISPRKKEVLESAVTSYQREPIRSEEVDAKGEEILRLRKNGERFSKIARAIGFAHKAAIFTIREYCYRHGVEPEGREGNADGGKRSIGIGPVEEKLPQVEALRAEGKTYSEIAEAVGLKDEESVQCLRRRAAERGKITPLERTHRMRDDYMPVIVVLRSQGKTWREIGETLGLGEGQKAAVRALSVVSQARREGGIDPEDDAALRSAKDGRTTTRPLVEQMLKLEAEGLDHGEIAARLGLPDRQKVTQALHRAQKAGKVERKTRLDAADERVAKHLAEILHMRREGCSYGRIGEHLGLGEGQRGADAAIRVVERARATGKLTAEDEALLAAVKAGGPKQRTNTRRGRSPEGRLAAKRRNRACARWARRWSKRTKAA